ncbi:hypothetical protein JCM10908_000895 [Rhodotorula pacifica]|uniref:uncharacterized protein n=1 Tax=Rhodotorula pacifica TaxID=1495444 RepID=UPI00317BC85A
MAASPPADRARALPRSPLDDAANAAEQTGAVDHLSKLPNELLQRIFNLAYARKKPSAPLSRRLRPFYDALVFRKVKAGNDSRVRALYELLAGRPGLGVHLHDLTIEDWSANSRIKIEEIKALFGYLTSLQSVSLRVIDSKWLDAVLPATVDAPSVLPACLSSLMIKVTGHQRDDAYDPAHLVALAQLPSLSTLELDFAGPKYQRLCEPKDPAPALSLPKISNFAVSLHAVDSSISALLGCLPHLRTLALGAYAPKCDFSSALNSLRSPAEVKELTLRADPPAGWSFPVELALLTSLDTLRLVGKWQNLGSDIFAALRQLPISKLIIGKGSDVSAAALKDFLAAGDHKVKTLSLHHLSAAYPRTVDKKKPFDIRDYADDDYEAAILLDSFVLPKWTTAFTQAGCQSLCAAAIARQIAVKGSTVAAVRIDREWSDAWAVVKEEMKESPDECPNDGEDCNCRICRGY